MATALCWDDRFATHDMGRGAMYLPIEGLIEDDLHVDNTARISRTRNLIRARRARRRAPGRRAPGGDGRGAACGCTRASTSSGWRRCRGRRRRRRRRVHADGRTLLRARAPRPARRSRRSSSSSPARCETAHAMLRRSGHHAWRDSGYGFCIFNNCASPRGPRRSSSASAGSRSSTSTPTTATAPSGSSLDDPSVLTVSIHQDRSFPSDSGFGRGRSARARARARNVNVNLPAGTGDPGYLYALDRIVAAGAAPVSRRSWSSWPAASTRASSIRSRASASRPPASPAIAERLLAVADELCGGRLVSVQEGGYSHVYAPFCWLAVVETLARVCRAPRGSLRALHRRPAVLSRVPGLAA